MRKSWITGGVVAFLFAAVLLLPSVAFAGGTESGTVIEGDGSGTWTGGSVASNTAKTTVLSGYGINLTSPSDDSGIAGAEVEYTFIIKNIGNCNDDFTITLSSTTWPSTLNTTTISSLSNDATASFTVTVGIPAGAADNADDSFTVEVKDQGGVATEDDWPTTGNDTVTSPTITTTAHAPSITLVLSVDEPATKPYVDLTYTADYSNGGGANADDLVLTFNLHTDTKYVKGSATSNSIHSGGAVTIWYHDGSWSTTEPADDGDGCCSGVTMIRFTYTGAVAPTDGGQVEYKARIK
jgi:hypothetical protein